ncbi:MAG: 1,6-anhydro-N-acetylmuramyl-L-alanine amidase AmpD [Spongiibacteraceae bacterium]
MYSIDCDGWLRAAVPWRSTNFDSRSAGVDVELLVIHNISLPAGNFGGPFIHELFANCLNCEQHHSFSDLLGLRVSSHLLIDRCGGISQFVSFNDRAWHAGVSQFHGRDKCNDFSIGIELEGCDDKAYTAAQYRELVEVSKTLQAHYPRIIMDNIVGHCDIAPGRKTDPGAAFDWSYYKNALE